LDEEDDSIEDLLRATTLVLLRLFFVQAYAQLENTQQELDLLRSMPDRPPSPPPLDARETARKADDDMWRLDQPVLTGGPDGHGPLLDSGGKVRHIIYITTATL
jgi:immunoglobulin-binding protein 1